MNQSINNLNSILNIQNEHVISCFSIWSALYMVLLGCSDDTQIQNVIGNVKEININNIILKLKSKINYINCMFINENYKVLPQFEKNIKAIGKIGKVVLPDDLIIINKFIEHCTKNMIKNMLSKNNITSNTKIILVNAIYFKGIWKKPFLSKNTKNSIFLKYFKNKEKCKLMEQIDYGNYFEDNKVQIYEKEYENNMVMGFILPKNNNINIKDYSNIKFNKEKVHLYIPIFSIKYKLLLKETFQKIGIIDIFKENANPLKKIGENLYVSDIIHSANVQVDEKGTIAAATTAVIIGREMAVSPDLTIPKIFKADHSFYWYIKDLDTNIILFSGYY